VPTPEKQLSYGAAYTAFKKLLKGTGLDPSQYGLHSLRAGATTDAFAKNVPPHLIDKKGRWKCTDTKYRYLNTSENDLNRATVCIIDY